MNEKVKKPDLLKLENNSSMTNDEDLIGKKELPYMDLPIQSQQLKH